MDNKIKSDLFRYDGLTGTKGLLKGLSIPGFRYTYLMRMAAKSRQYGLKWRFFTFLLQRYEYKYGFQIPYNTQIGEGLYIAHFGTIVIGALVKIGKNFSIMHGITIGRTNRGDKIGYPTIGDNVWIGTGAVVIGNINIGSNVLIAPNSFVNFDVPDNSLVLGNPGIIHKKEKATEEYILSVLE
jgi:serine O-acetyltransferase